MKSGPLNSFLSGYILHASKSMNPDADSTNKRTKTNAKKILFLRVWILFLHISEIIQLDFDKFRLRVGWRWEVVAAL